MMQHTARTAPLPTRPAPARTLSGEVRDGLNRYGVQLHTAGDTIEGRLGGRWLGERLRLQLEDHAHHGLELLGSVSSGLVRLTVRASYRPDPHTSNTGTLELRVVGPNPARTATLRVTADSASGTASHGDRTYPLRFALSDGALNGSSGTDGEHGLSLSAQGLGGPVLAAIAAIVDATHREVTEVALEHLRFMGGA